MSAHSLLFQCSCELIRGKISFSVKSSFGSRKERKKSPRRSNQTQEQVWGKSSWSHKLKKEKLEAAYVAVPFPPFNFRNGQNLIVRPAVIVVISVALQQTQPGGQRFVASSIRTGPKNQCSSPVQVPRKPAVFLSSFLSSPGYLLR